MKKFILVALVAVFTVASCTNQNVENEDYENGIQLINKKDGYRPGNQGSSNSSN